jgi:general secretion pathway protein H
MASLAAMETTQTSPTERACRSGSEAGRGFTLLEISITIALLALAVMIALPGIESVTGVQMRSSAGQLSGLIRGLYDQAALGGQTCRLSIDLDQRTYWPECAKGAVRISRTKEESRDGQRYVDEAAVQREKDRLTNLQRDNPVQAELESKTAFSRFENLDLKKATLPEGVSFDWVWSEHQTQKYVGGSAYIYFFPSGATERAIVALKHKDDIVSITVNALSGRVEIVPGAAEIPR